MKYIWIGEPKEVAGFKTFTEGEDVSHLPKNVLNYLMEIKCVELVKPKKEVK